MSYLLHILGRGLGHDLGDVLDRYYWSPQPQPLDQLRHHAEQHTDWPDVQFQCGLAMLRAVMVEEAVDYLEHACMVKPAYTPARLALASAYADLGRHEEAYEQLVQANDIDRGQGAILFAMGFSCERLGKPVDATDHYRAAIEADPALVLPRERLAAVALVLNDLDVAIEQYEFLKDYYPEEPWIRSALANLYHRCGEHAQAVEQFEAAIAMDPENWSLRDDEVESLIADGRFQLAIRRLKEMIEIQPEFPDLYVRLGDAYARLNDDDKAMAAYRHAADIQPDYLEARIKIGVQHLMFGRWEQAAEAFCEACYLNDQATMQYIGLGVAQLAQGNHDQALESFELARSVEPNSSVLLSEAARLQLKSSLAEEYLQNFYEDTPEDPGPVDLNLDNDDLLHKQIDRHAEQVRQRPSHADLRYRYGVLLRAEGRLGEALEQFKAAVEINEGYTQARVKLGITQQDLGLESEAIATFKQVLDLSPNYLDVHYRLGVLYTNRHEFESATEHMEVAADGAPGSTHVRAGLALALQNMGLTSEAVATWRQLWRQEQNPAA
jgi:tetratricopeptide (TPR) repeat protein